MKKNTKLSRSAIVIFIIVSSVFCLTKCVNEQKEKAAAVRKVKFQQFAGSEKCTGCHKDIYDKHIRTAHYLTSRPALEKYIKGSFKSGENEYAYDTLVQVKMEKRDSGLYQVIYYKGEEKKALRFNIITGSGTKGQTFAYWQNNNLFQLPITYFTAADHWSNSPGFPNKVLYQRPITSRCLECHSTYANVISAPNKEPEEFAHDQIIFGVDCEKCHGPAADHVKFQTANPKDTQAKFIVNPANFTRQQSLELCALCHGGRMEKTQPSFEFISGDTLGHYFALNKVSKTTTTENIDVHGNQYGMLQASECFRMSKTMTCNTCHNTHENERGQIKLFSERCMSCHNTEHSNFCKINPNLVSGIKKNCIDCHMPAKPSQVITLLLPGADKPTPAMIRTHLIKIYPDETKRFISREVKAHKIN